MSFFEQPLAEYPDGALLLAHWPSGCTIIDGVVAPAIVSYCWAQDGMALEAILRGGESGYEVISISAEVADGFDGGLPPSALTALKRCYSAAGGVLDAVRQRVAALRDARDAGELEPETTVDSLTGMQKRRRIDPEVASVAMFLVAAIGLDATAEMLDVSTMQVRRYLLAARAMDEI